MALPCLLEILGGRNKLQVLWCLSSTIRQSCEYIWHHELGWVERLIRWALYLKQANHFFTCASAGIKIWHWLMKAIKLSNLIDGCGDFLDMRGSVFYSCILIKLSGLCTAFLHVHWSPRATDPPEASITSSILVCEWCTFLFFFFYIKLLPRFIIPQVGSMNSLNLVDVVMLIIF